MKRIINIESKEIDEVEEYIYEAYAPVIVKPLDKSEIFGIDGVVTHFDDVMIEWSRTIGNYYVTPTKPFESVIFNLMTKRSMIYNINGKRIELEEGSAVAYKHPDKVDVLNESEHTTVAISKNALQKRLTILLDGASTRELDFFNQPIPRSSIQKFSDFVCDLKTSPMLAMAALMRHRTESVADVIIDAFLMSYPNNCSEILYQPVPSIAPRQVKRALDYIHSHPEAHTGPETLAALSGVSVRSLQYSFKNVTGHTITEYQHLLRLRLARQDMIQNPDLPIKVVAEKWGFGSLGAFGQSFKKVYGAAPSSIKRLR